MTTAFITAGLRMLLLAILITGVHGRVPYLCATEDSRNCVWIVGVQGGGQGRSFIDIGGEPYYIRQTVNQLAEGVAIAS